MNLSRETWRRWRPAASAGLAPSIRMRECTLKPPAHAPPRHERARRRERHSTRSAHAARSIAPLSSRSRAANLDIKHALPHSAMIVELSAAGHPLLAPWSLQEVHPAAAEHPFARLCTTGRTPCATPSIGPRVLDGSDRSSCMCSRECTPETPAPAALARIHSDHSAASCRSGQKHAFSAHARRACTVTRPGITPTPTDPFAPLGA